MLFSSTIFLFLFLPVVLALYFSVRPGLRNGLLLLASLLFYAWGEKLVASLMLVSIAGNWAFGLWVGAALARGRGKGVVALATVFNLGLLVAFKYADWLWIIFRTALFELGIFASHLPPLAAFIDPGSAWHDLLVNAQGGIRLPIGISFFTFQAFSYVLDVYRRDAVVQKNPLDVALYVSLFPQLIAGPIVRYKDVAAQIVHRVVTREGFANGIRRFAIGLGKKVMIANAVARCADAIFAIPAAELTAPVSWLGLVCYSLQIYFDFSGYSDMAIGLGHMFGFKFLENFAHPYISKSITEFWRRWHISLSTWFRDYLYIPLGGNRKGPARTYFNLLLVFFLCGLWHGASFSFVVWGLFHGCFLVIERIGLQRMIEKRAVLRHVYVALVVMVGWVFFRAETLDQALHYLGTMAGLSQGLPAVHHVDLFLDSLLATALAAGFIGSTPWLPALVAWHARLAERGRPKLSFGLEVAGLAALLLLFFCSTLELAAGSYNPFIYFRF
ncbi:MAG: MBOAT family O-acyltransferase [Planctomycetota bacterium]